MKKKHLLTTLISILMILVFAGCSNSGNSNQTTSNGNGGNRPAFQKPNVYGEVDSISGNNVTLKLMNFPQMNKRNGGGRGNGNMGTVNGAPANRNGNGNGNGNWNGNGGQGRGGMGARSYTGQQQAIIIPNNVSITEMTRGTNGMTQTNVNLNDIQTGSVLSIYYDNDGKTIKSIRVQRPFNGNGQGGNGQSGNAQTGNVAS